MPGFFQIQRRPFAQHRLGQKRFHAAFRLFLCAFKLQIKSIRIDVQCAADKKRFDFSVFPKSRDKPRQHTRIKLVDAFNAATILGRNRVTGHNQHVANLLHRQPQQKCFGRVDISVPTGHMRKGFYAQLS